MIEGRGQSPLPPLSPQHTISPSGSSLGLRSRPPNRASPEALCSPGRGVLTGAVGRGKDGARAWAAASLSLPPSACPQEVTTPEGAPCVSALPWHCRSRGGRQARCPRRGDSWAPAQRREGKRLPWEDAAISVRAGTVSGSAPAPAPHGEPWSVPAPLPRWAGQCRAVRGSPNADGEAALPLLRRSPGTELLDRADTERDGGSSPSPDDGSVERLVTL